MVLHPIYSTAARAVVTHYAAVLRSLNLVVDVTMGKMIVHIVMGLVKVTYRIPDSIDRIIPSVETLAVRDTIQAFDGALLLKAMNFIIRTPTVPHLVCTKIVCVPVSLVPLIFGNNAIVIPSSPLAIKFVVEKSAPKLSEKTFQEAFPFGSKVLQARYATWADCRDHFSSLHPEVIKWCDGDDANSMVGKYHRMWCEYLTEDPEVEVEDSCAGENSSVSSGTCMDMVLYQCPSSVQTEGACMDMVLYTGPSRVEVAGQRSSPVQLLLEAPASRRRCFAALTWKPKFGPAKRPTQQKCKCLHSWLLKC
jgi:hypothetical protein